MEARSKAVVVLLIVGVSGLLTESVRFTYDYAGGVYGDTANDRLLAELAVLSIVYGSVFAVAALMASPRLSSLWRPAPGGRHAPRVLARRVFVLVAAGVLLEIILQVYLDAIGFVEFGYSLKLLLGIYPMFGMLLAVAIAMLDRATPQRVVPLTVRANPP